MDSPKSQDTSDIISYDPDEDSLSSNQSTPHGPTILDRMNLLVPSPNPKFLHSGFPILDKENSEELLTKKIELMSPISPPLGFDTQEKPPLIPLKLDQEYPQSHADQSGSHRYSGLTSGNRSTRAVTQWRKVKLIKKGFVRSKLEPVVSQTTPQALELVHDKAFTAYQDEAKNRRKKKRKKPKEAKLKSLLHKHAASQQTGGNSQILADAMDKIIYRRQTMWFKAKVQARKKVKRIVKITRRYLDESSEMLKPIRPDGLRRFCWDILLMLFIVQDLIFIPMDICFGDDFDGVRWLDTLENIETCFFIVDILVNFNTAVLHEGNVVFARKIIAKDYLKSWFWIDLISSFPYIWIADLVYDSDIIENIHNTAQVIKVIRLFRFLKIIRIVRLAKLKRIISKIEDILQSSAIVNGLLSLIKLVIFIAFLAHWCACFWYAVGSSIDRENWLIHVELENSSLRDRYVAALYFAVTTMMTVGYGDIVPVDVSERVFAIFLMLLGGGIFGYALNAIATIAQSIEGEKSKFKRKMYVITRFMQRKGLTKEIQGRVKKYLEFTLENNDRVKQEEAALLNTLSDNMREEIFKQINGKFLNENPIFQKNFSKSLLYLLSLKLEEKMLAPKETIFDPYNHDFAIYFISKGSVGIFYEGFMHPLQVHSQGGYFGEVSFFTGFPMPVTARSIDFSHIIYLKKTEFIELLDTNGLDKETFCGIKDNINIYENYTDLQLKCPVCGEMDHPAYKCSKIHFVPSKKSAVLRLLRERDEFRANFKRHDKIKVNSRRNLEYLKASPASIRQKYPSLMRKIEAPSVQITSLSQVEAVKKALYSPNTLSAVSSKRESILFHFQGGKKREAHIILSRKDGIGSYVYPQQGIELIVDSEEEDCEMDMVRNYEIYFPHNNISKIIPNMEKKTRKGKAHLSFDMRDTEYLKQRLGKFFKKSHNRGLMTEYFMKKKSTTQSSHKPEFQRLPSVSFKALEGPEEGKDKTIKDFGSGTSSFFPKLKDIDQFNSS